jgi:hypothetical protein
MDTTGKDAVLHIPLTKPPDTCNKQTSAQISYVAENMPEEESMLNCFIDGQARSFGSSDAFSLAAILNGLNGDLEKSGRIIASLRVNGEEITSEEEKNVHLQGTDSVEITTETPGCLAIRILGESQDYINELQNYLLLVAGQYTSGSENTGLNFAEAVQGLQWFVQMTDFIGCTLQINFQKLMLNSRPVEDYVKDLNSILQEIVKAQTGCDPVLLADILEYDLVPHLEEWKSIYTLFEGELKANFS